MSEVRFSSARRQVLSCTVLNASSETVGSDMSNCATSISSDSSPVPPVAPYLVHFNLPPHVDDSSPVTVDEANGTGFVSCINLLLCPTDSAPALVTIAGTPNAHSRPPLKLAVAQYYGTKPASLAVNSGLADRHIQVIGSKITQCVHECVERLNSNVKLRKLP
jgi:hypothetical protein